MELLTSAQLLAAALVTGSLYGLVALGLNLIYGTMRLLNIAHGEFVMVGAYAAYWLFALFGLGPPWSLLVATALAAGLGWAAYRWLFRLLLARGARIEANSLLAFFALSVILQNGAALLFTATERGGGGMGRILDIAGASIAAERALALAVALGACIAAAVFLRFSRAGRAIRALAQHREAAMVVGIDVDRVQRLSFALGLGAAGLAGALVSMVQTVSPFMGFPFTIAAFVVVILGGLGNPGGSLGAGLLLGVVETYGVALTAPAYRSMLVYGAFITVLLLCPRGLMGAGRARR